jgi:rRNA maturation RNase YbeY
MSGTLCLRNRQQTRRINVPLLRRILRHLLAREFQVQSFELCLHLVEATEMAELNEKFLRHLGSTDVITFNYAEPDQAQALQGDIFICIDEAVAQARRFRTTWQSEAVRYAIHGLLHLRGFDDSKAAARKKMKYEENRLLGEAAQLFDLRRLGKAAV